MINVAVAAPLALPGGALPASGKGGKAASPSPSAVPITLDALEICFDYSEPSVVAQWKAALEALAAAWLVIRDSGSGASAAFCNGIGAPKARDFQA